jgi:hypothetical protein
LDAHQIELEPVALLGDDPPAMPRGLAGDDHIVEPRGTGLLARPDQDRLKLPRPSVLQPPAAEHRAIMVDDHELLRLIGQIDPADRTVTRNDLTQPPPAVITTDIAP